MTIHIVDLVPSCGSQDELDLRTNRSDDRLTIRWDPLAALAGRAPVQGYETEIRRGDTGAWTGSRTFLGRNITGAVYGDLDNEVGYQVRVRPVNAEGDCEWSTLVSGTPTADRTPKDDVEYYDRFGPHPVGTPARNLRLLTPGRCRHTLDGVKLDADCTYERTAPLPHQTLRLLERDAGRCDEELENRPLVALAELPVAEALQRVPNEAVGLVPAPGFEVHRLVAFHEGAKVDRKRSVPDCA